jgi:branched-chain amino acid transport system permease protein
VLLELANKFDGITGGADGLQGVVMGPLLGASSSTWARAWRRSTRWRCCSWPSCCCAAWCIRRWLSLQALRDNRLRLSAIGMSVNGRLAAVYTLGRRWPARPARCWRRPPASPRWTCSSSTAAPT